MEKTKENALMNCSTLDELLNVEFGAVGTPVRDEFDKETEAFCLAQTLREERIRAGLTQEQLALKIGTKKIEIPYDSDNDLDRILDILGISMDGE